MNELKQGTPLQGGKYIIKRVLGQGGFGITYLSEQVSLGREVAIKEFFMKDNCMRDIASGAMTVPTTGSSVQVCRYREKFLKEARTLASLDHPHIISVIDVFEENRTVYYSMPYMPKGSLKEFVAQRGHLTESESMRYTGQIADALKYMHSDRHICHYDIKPDNILIDRKGNAVLIDFGISKNYDADGHETSSTPVGMSEGYAPIEQYQQMVGEFSPASDVYALGATLYFMITGAKPPTVVSRIGGEELVFPGEVSPSIKMLIEKAMTIGIKNRPNDVGLFLGVIDLNGPNVYDQQPQPREMTTEETVFEPTADEREEDKSGSSNAVRLVVDKLLCNMVSIEGGQLFLGCKEGLFEDNETNAHIVEIPSFSISKYQVTQEQWTAVMGNNPSFFKGYNLPVECVSWEDCQEFIEKLNKNSKMSFRLPTEAEWEFAARGAITGARYHFKFPGDKNISNVGWWEENSNNCTHPIGEKSPNSFGLYDMSGNVWEWCQDWYGKYDKHEDFAPTGPKVGTMRVVRGGSYEDNKECCRISYRFYYLPTDRRNCIGLRLAMD